MIACNAVAQRDSICEQQYINHYANAKPVPEYKRVSNPGLALQVAGVMVAEWLFPWYNQDSR